MMQKESHLQNCLFINSIAIKPYFLHEFCVFLLDLRFEISSLQWIHRYVFFALMYTFWHKKRDKIIIQYLCVIVCVFVYLSIYRFNCANHSLFGHFISQKYSQNLREVFTFIHSKFTLKIEQGHIHSTNAVISSLIYIQANCMNCNCKLH